MSLAERLVDATPQPACLICNWYQQLNPTDREAFDTWLGKALNKESGYSLAALYRACNQEGLKAGQTTFLTHLREHR